MNVVSFNGLHQNFMGLKKNPVIFKKKTWHSKWCTSGQWGERVAELQFAFTYSLPSQGIWKNKMGLYFAYCQPGSELFNEAKMPFISVRVWLKNEAGIGLLPVLHTENLQDVSIYSRQIWWESDYYSIKGLRRRLMKPVEFNKLHTPHAESATRMLRVIKAVLNPSNYAHTIWKHTNCAYKTQEFYVHFC